MPPDAVQRTLVASDPPARGSDVLALQGAVRRALRARGLAEQVPLPGHGVFTHATALAGVEAQYSLGLDARTYLNRDARGRRMITEEAQRVLHDPSLRAPEELQRAHDRRTLLERGPRFYEALAAEAGPVGHGSADALAFAAATVGPVTPEAVDRWCRATGYADPVPWSACFVNACLMVGGLPSGAGWIGFPPAILERSRSATAGWSWHRTGAPGDLALYGADGAEHVELVHARTSATEYLTIGGHRDGSDLITRSSAPPATGRLIGFARPPWKRRRTRLRR